jgi:hypothetical protein
MTEESLQPFAAAAGAAADYPSTLTYHRVETHHRRIRNWLRRR